MIKRNSGTKVGGERPLGSELTLCGAKRWKYGDPQYDLEVRPHRVTRTIPHDS